MLSKLNLSLPIQKLTLHSINKQQQQKWQKQQQTKQQQQQNKKEPHILLKEYQIIYSIYGKPGEKILT